MSLRSLSLATAAALVLASPSGAQSLIGTYSTTNPQGGAVTIVFRDAGGGKVGGTLSGNGNTFEISGMSQGNGAEGTVEGNGQKMFFGAAVEGDNLRLILAEPDANGQPNFQRATQLSFKRTAGVPAGGGQAAGGNPLGGGRAAAASDRYAGAWSSKDVQLSLSGGDGKYSGTLTHQGQNYPITLKDEGPGLSGTFTAGGSPYEVLIKHENGFLHLNTAGTTYMLAKGTGGANPLGGGANVAGGGGGRRSPEDEKMFQMFIANGWCSFSYKSGSTYSTTGGTTSTGKVYMNANGTVSATRSSETTSSGSSGQAYVGGQSGAQGFWKYENGVLYMGQTPQAMAPQQFKMTYNSNGYPIPIVNGTEYMICR